MKEGRQSECEKAIPEWAPLHGSDWLAMGHTSKANIPEISVFYVRAATMSWGNNNKGTLSLGSRRGLLAYVYSGVFVWSNTNECLSGGNCSYIVRLSVRDLHGPTPSSHAYSANWFCRTRTIDSRYIFQDISVACGICYAYRLDAQIPDQVCEDSRCAQPFHQTCLYEVRNSSRVCNKL